MSHTFTDIEPQRLRGSAAPLVPPSRRPDPPVADGARTNEQPIIVAETEPGSVDSPRARPLGLRELAMGAVGATLGAALVLAGVVVALAGAWAALTGSDLWFWSWAEPAPLAAGAMVVVGIPVAVYAACTIWLCVLFVPLLTFRLLRGLLSST